MNNVLYRKKIFHISLHFTDNAELVTVVPGICIHLFIFKTQGQILVCDRVKGDLKSFLLLKMCLKNGEWILLAVVLLSLRTDLRA